MEKSPNETTEEVNNNNNTRTDHGPMAVVKAWYMLVLHFIFCLILALVILYAVDGYKALGGDNESHHQSQGYVLRTGDVMTLISMGLVLVKLTVASWSALAISRCAFFCLEKGMTISQFGSLLSFKIPPQIFPRDKFGVAIILLLLGVIPQAFIAPLLSGSVNWNAAFEDGVPLNVTSGNPTSNFGLWGYWQVSSNVNERVGAVRRAAGLAGSAWATDINGTRNGTATTPRCRHVMNDVGLSANTTLLNVTMPCLIIHSITWPTVATSDIPPAVTNIAKNSTQLSLSGANPLSYVNYPGNGVIFDPTNETLQAPYTGILNSSPFDDALTELLDHPQPPTPLRYSGSMTAVVQVAQNYLYGPKNADAFGYAELNNRYTTTGGGVLGSSLGSLLGGFLSGGLTDIGKLLDDLYADTTYTYLEINFTAGVMTGPATYLSSKAVEGNQIPSDADIVEALWVREALYLLPDVMSTVAIMNTTQLNSYHNIENYTANLLTYSFQGAWDMLQRSFDRTNTNLTAIPREPRVQASVVHSRVYGWLFMSLLFTLSSLPLWWLTKQCKRSAVIDGQTALLMTDPSEVLKEHGDLTDLASVTKSEGQIMLRLEESSAGRFRLVSEKQLEGA
jgi:hypothetical protein